MTIIKKFCKMEDLSIKDTLTILRQHCKENLTGNSTEITSVADYFTCRFTLVEHFTSTYEKNVRCVVWKDKVSGELYKQEFPYNSYDGSHEEMSEWWHVKARQVIVTEYNICKEQYNVR